VSAPIKSLGLRPGDTLVVYRVDDDQVTIAFDRPSKLRSSGQSAREFAQRWIGQFPVPMPNGDERLNHIIAKHVK
jgi:hypothetical protein